MPPWQCKDDFVDIDFFLFFFLPSSGLLWLHPSLGGTVLLEKEAMFRDSGGALTQQPSLDNGLDGPYPSAAGKLEQVRGELGTSLGKTVLFKECLKILEYILWLFF